MSRVVKNNRGFLQLLAYYATHQCEFLLRTATPQQVFALVQVLYNVLMQYTPFPEENRQNLLPYKDVLISLAEPNVPYKKKKPLTRSLTRPLCILIKGTHFLEGIQRERTRNARGTQ